QTMSRIRELGLRVAELPPLTDIDEPDHLKTWRSLCETSSTTDAEPWLSVIIPVVNQPSLLAATIRSAFQAVGVEVLVCGDGQNDHDITDTNVGRVRHVSTHNDPRHPIIVGMASARASHLMILEGETRL